MTGHDTTDSTRSTTDAGAGVDANANANTSRETMGEISHANPYTGETVGQVFRRGPTVAADGGRANAAAETERTMSDVSHTPPNDSEGANRVFERGRNGAVENE